MRPKRETMTKISMQGLLQFIRTAQSSALKSTLDNLVGRYKDGGHHSEEILQQIINLPGFLPLLEDLAFSYIRRVHPYIDEETANDLASKVMYYMWKTGIKTGLDSYDPQNTNGVRSPYNWLVRRVKQVAQGAVSQHNQKVKSSTDLLDNSVSYDNLVNQHPKYVTDEYNPAMPSYMDYMASGQGINYKAILKKLQEKIREMDTSGKLGRREFEELENLRKWRDDLMARIQLENNQAPLESSNTQFPESTPVSLMRKHKGKLVSRNVADIDNIVTKASDRARYFQGSGRWVADNAFLPVYKLDQYQVDQNGRLPMHIIFKRAYEITDPQTARRIMEAMYESIVEAKMHADVAGRSDKAKGIRKLVTIEALQKDFLNTFKMKLEAMGLDGVARDQILDRAARLDRKEWRNILYNADELLRYYQYDYIRTQNLNGKSWADLDANELKQIRDTAYDNLGYNEGALMALRRFDGAKETFGVLRNNTPEEEKKRIMDAELQNWKAGLSDKKLVVREQASYPYFARPKEEFQVMSAASKASIRIAETIENMARLAIFLDDLGDYSTADLLDQTFKTASRIAAKFA
jgi:hypothetical protein